MEHKMKQIVLRLRNRGNNGNAMTLQVGVNTANVGGFNQLYAYLQGRFWGGGNNPILLILRVVILESV